MKKVLVTGGAGFIGSNVVGLLSSKGYDVVVLDNLTTGYMENLEGLDDVRFVKGDIRDAALVEEIIRDNEIGTVYHLAGTVGNLKSMELPKEDAEVNVLGTLNLLETARKYGVGKIVFSSSSAIFGELQYLPIDEKHPVEPDSPYGVSKLASEKHCLCYSRLYDMEIVCLRYFNVFGKNQRYDPYGNVIPIWANNVFSDKPLRIFGDGTQTRDFINVEDVAMANVMAGETPGLSGVFNLGTGSSITISSLAEIFSKISGSSLEVIYEDPRKGEVMHSKADISRAVKAFGFSPSIDIEQGVRAYVGWIKDEFYS